MEDEYLEAMNEEMEKPIKRLRVELARVRTGRASLAVLDGIKVDYYGSATPLSGVASLSVPEPRMIIVKPWDQTMLATIEKAIGASQLGINPQNDGKIIRLAFPELTGERRKDLVRQIKEMGEQSKVSVRGSRREYNELFKSSQKDGDLTEDDLKRLLDKVQAETNGHCSKIDSIVASKEAEILEI
ncbi:MAG: ribosome recycling factor [Deltaproteobacteria bacterium]|nr:ribosome recycling factor [Deltaproteobacteria bacterium]